LIKVDLHVHSRYSPDASGTIPEILRYARSRRLDAIAITDHDTFEGSLAARKIRSENDVQVIPGIELTIPGGPFGTHLIVLYVEDKFPCPNIIEAVRGIKQRGGVLVLPHPYRRGTGLLTNAREGLVSNEEVAFVLANVDYIEGLNFKDTNDNVTRTLELVAGSGRPMVSGTDAHVPAEIGVLYCEVESLEDLRKGTAAPSIVAYTRAWPGAARAGAAP
jgi:predicted metal-dependent phosphoesterase TrpH